MPSFLPFSCCRCFLVFLVFFVIVGLVLCFLFFKPKRHDSAVIFTGVS